MDDDPGSVEGRANGRLESALMLHVLLLHPRPLTVWELIEELAADPTDPGDRRAVVHATTTLERIGLLRLRYPFALPTPAAIRSYELWEC